MAEAVPYQSDSLSPDEGNSPAMTVVRFPATTELSPAEWAKAQDIFRRVANAFVTGLSSRLRLPFRLQVDRVGPFEPGQEAAGPAQRYCQFLAQQHESEPVLAMEWPVWLAIQVVERLLGAVRPGRIQEDRELTDSEVRILSAQAGWISAVFDSVWKGSDGPALASGGFRAAAREGSRSLPRQGLIECAMTLLGWEREAPVRVIASARLLRRILEADAHTDAGAQRDGRHDPNVLLANLHPARVSAEAILDGANIRLGELFGISPGSVLMLETPVGRPVLLRLNGSVSMSGEVLKLGNKRAFQVAKA